MAGFPWCLGVICLEFVSSSNSASPLVLPTAPRPLREGWTVDPGGLRPQDFPPSRGPVALRLALGGNGRTYPLVLSRPLPWRPMGRPQSTGCRRQALPSSGGPNQRQLEPIARLAPTDPTLEATRTRQGTHVGFRSASLVRDVAARSYGRWADDSGIPWAGLSHGLLRHQISTFSGRKDRAGSMFLTGATWPQSCGRARWGEVRNPDCTACSRDIDWNTTMTTMKTLCTRSGVCLGGVALLALTTAATACTGRQQETPPATTTAATPLPQAPPRPTRPSRTPPRRWMPSRKRCGSWRTSRSPETSTRSSSAARFAWA